MNKHAKYFSEVGSYRGAIKIGNRWIAAYDLNRIKKDGWERWQGPPSFAIARALQDKAIRADLLFPERKKGG